MGTLMLQARYERQNHLKFVGCRFETVFHQVSFHFERVILAMRDAQGVFAHPQNPPKVSKFIGIYIQRKLFATNGGRLLCIVSRRENPRDSRQFWKYLAVALRS